MNVRKLHFFFFFQISDKLFSLRVPFTEPWSSVRCLNHHVNCNLSSWVGGVKMHFKSVSVYVNLSKNSLSPKYGMYKTVVPFLPLYFICTVLSMWKMSACDWKAPYLLRSSTHRVTAVSLVIPEMSCFPLEFQKKP